MYDVVVVGGNLAGTISAINATTEGVSVALVERNKKPFYPAHCGEAIRYSKAKILNLTKIGCAKNEIKNIIINVSSSKEYTLNLKDYWLIFDRNYLEKELLKKAEKIGVKLILGMSMKDFVPPHEIVLDNSKKIRGKIIIDASGIACQIGRRIGIAPRLRPEDIGVCIQSRVQSHFNADTIKMWFHTPYAPFGYAWIFPLDEKMANIGIMVKGKQDLDLSELLEIFMKDMINNKYRITNTFRACVPLALPLNRLMKDNVMIVGDAARLANSVSGAGIYNAFFSGRLAGLTASKYIHGEIPSLESYQDALNVKISRLKNIYHFKSKLETEKKFVRAFRIFFSITCFINKTLPTLLQNHISKIFRDEFENYV